MKSPAKFTWIARCVLRMAELQPSLPSAVACRLAERLWQDERGHVPPEEWAEIEVKAMGHPSPMARRADALS